MTNKFFSMVDGNCIGIAPNLTSRLPRVGSVSIVSRQSVLPILLLFLSLFMGVGNAWGVDPTETVTISTIASANSWTNGNHYSGWTSSSGKFTFTAANTGQGLYYSSDNSWRGYNSKGAMVITAGSGITIKSVSSSPSKTWTVNGSSAGNNASFTPTATTKFTSFTITYTETASKTLSSISITTQPNTRKYLVGETFSKTGAVVRATYSDASTADVSSSATWTPSGALTAGTSKTMTASYTESGTTKTATTTVDVYSVTVQKQDETGATITAGGVSASASGRTLTASATAASHYVFRRWKYGTAAGTSIASTSSANTTLNGTPTGNVTIIAEFYKPIPVTWNKDGSLHATTYTGYNQKPVFPSNPSSCNATSNTFYGWATGTWDNTVDNLTGKTVYTSADDMPNVTAAGTVYNAVFAKATDTSTPANFTSTFSSASWGDANSLWDSGKAGNSLQSGRGVQVTTGATGANATTKSSYSNVSSVVVTYSTNASSGAGSIAIKVGDTNYTGNASVSTSGGTTDRTITYTGTSNVTGKVKITVNCTTNSLYVKSVQVNYSTGGTSYSKYLTTCCDPLESINGSVSWTDGKAEIHCANLADVTSWGVKYKLHSATNYTTYTGEATWEEYDDQSTKDMRKILLNDLNLAAGSQYNFKVTGSYSGSTYCTGTFEAALSPSSSSYVPQMGDPSKSSITELGYIAGAETSTAQSFTISASHLTGNLTVSAPNNNFEVSTTSAASGFGSSATLTPTSGALTNAEVWVRLALSKEEGTYGGNTTYVTITGGGAAGKQVSVTGSVGAACHTPSISGSLSDATYNLNADADALTISASKGDNSDPDLTYQWLQCTTSDGTYVNAVGGTGATSNSYTPPTTTAGSSLYYKCKVSSGKCFDYSGIAHIQVNTPVIKLNDATNNINLGFGDKAVDAVTGYTLTFNVSGQYLAENISINKSGTNAAMFTLSASSVSQTSGTATSTTITVTYKPSAAGLHSATLTLSSSQATSRTVTLSGTGKWLVTWSVGGQENPATNLAANEAKPTLPTPAPAGLTCKNTFKGWSKKDGKTIAKTTSYYNDLFTEASGAPAITEATTFYAVFGSASAPSTDLFSWNGGTSAALIALENVSAEGLGSDYAESNAPYRVKLDGTGDYINITTTAAIASVAVDVKMLGGASTSSITVKESADGNTFTDVETLSISGAQNDVLNLSTTESFASTSRVVRLYFTKGSNVGVGPISITGVETPDLVTECPAVEAPTFSPAAGEYHEAKDVTISCATVGFDEIRYTTDGSDPTKNTGTVYSSAITVDETMTIKAIAVKGDNVSDVVSATYTITYPRKVTFDAGAGTLSIAPATSITEEAYGEGITLPTATPSSYCVAEGWTFAGWATTNSTTTAPTIVSGTYTPESDITLYAVYKLGDENYHLVTELPTGEDIPGNYMIVNTANAKAMDAFVTGNYYLDQDATGTITDNTIIPANVTYFNYNHWTVTYESPKWIFYNEYQKQYLYNYCNDGTHHNVGITESKPNGYSIELSEGFAVFTSADDAGAHIWYDAAHSDFAGTTSTTNNLHLYKQATATYSSTPACCDDEVTVSKADNPSTGTFTLDKSGVLSTCAGSQVVTVTCVPNAGYHVDAVTETIETDVTIEETAENVYTVTYAKNVSGTSTISVTFAETLTPSFQISQNAFEIGDVAVGATVQRQFTISAAHLEGTSLSITSSNDKFTVSPTSLTIKTDGSVEEATVTVTLNTAEANIGGPYSTTITLADGATTPNTAIVSLTNATIKHQYNVKWYNGTTLLSEADYLDGATISDIPTATSCDQSISHVGWLPNATIDGKQADAPVGFVANEDLPAVTADVEYHAVFAKVGEASWRNTALADLTSEDVFVIAETSGYALSHANGTSSAPAAPSITITDGKITSKVTAAMKWNVSGNATDGYTFYPNGSTTTWLYCTDTNNGVRVGTNSNKVFTIVAGYLKHTATNRYVGVYNNSDWRCYDSYTGSQCNIKNQEFAYFKYIAPTIKDYMTTCAVTFSATYEAGSGTGDDYVDANLIEKNADYTVLGNDVTGFTKADYRFNGWKCGDDDYAAGATYENVTADLTFVAQWTEKEEADLEYATSAYEVIQNGSFTKPTLTNPHDLAVTYSSSNTNIATVDAEGNVTLKTDAIGSTIITASSEATDTYKAGEASYTLSVASKWALTYTSNVELVENSTTKASSATVNGYNAMKCGTTGVAGAMQITVPKNTKKLHIHAVGWKDESVTISITGATASPNSVDLTADNAISGSGSSYTLNRPSTFYKEITLSNITEATTLTLTATNGKRFVVYGVNEEGGIWELPSDDADESDIPSEVNVVVSEDQSLTINNAKTLSNLTIEAGGSVSGSAALNVQDLTINSQSGKSGQVSGSNVHVSGDIYLEIKLCEGVMDAEASRKWYCISAPFNVNMNGGFYWADGTPMVLNTHFQMFEFDGEKRASTGNGWKRVSGTMKKNTAYFIGFDDERVGSGAGMNQNTIKLKADANTIPTAEAMQLAGHSSAIEGSNDWYGLGNPALHYVGVNKTAQIFTCEVQGYDVIPHWDDTFTGFVVGSAFFVQGTGELSFNNAAGAYHAPKRQVEKYTYCVEIAKEGASRYDNRIFVRASEDAEAEFVPGKDEYTLNGTNSNYGALLWTENYGGKRLAIEEAPLVNGEASYVLTLSAPVNGQYRIAVAAPKENADLYLTYEGSIIWNLSMGAYPVDLNKGTTNGYGLLLKAKAPSTATGVESVQPSEISIQKVIIDDHVYILRGGQMYGIDGKAVK